MKYSLFLLTIGWLAISCECEHQYKFEVFNASEDTLMVYWIHNSISDSAEVLESTTKELFVTSHGSEPCRNGPIKKNVSFDLEAMSAVRNGVDATRNYLENSQWKYTEEGKQGLYVLTIDSLHFY